MRVLFLSVSAAFGGAERVLLEAVTALRAQYPEWPLRVLSLAEGPLVAELECRGAVVSVLPLPRRFASIGETGRSRGRTLVGLAGSAWSLQGYVRALRATVHAWRPDVVHANGLKAHILGAWATPRDAQLVWHVHDYVSTRGVSAVLLRRHAWRAALVIANSHSVAADVRTVVEDRARIEVVHNGVDLSRFTADGPTLDLDAAAGAPPVPWEAVRVGLVATYARWKGHETFLDAMARLSDLPVTAYVIGGPVYETNGSQYTREELEAAARASGLEARVRFVPFQQDVAPALRSLDIVVHASTAPEPFGLAVVEAMACGRSVVASQGGGVEEIIDSGRTGLLHRPGDAADLAAQVRRVVSDPYLRARLGAAAAASARARFGRDRFGIALSGVYQRLRAPDMAPALT